MKGWLLCIPVAVLALAACDEGKIYDNPGEVSTSGFTISMIGKVSGCDDYEAIPQYSVALAVFREDDDFAVSSKPVANGHD